MCNFVLVYKPYCTTMESEHYWTMYKNMCVFKKVIASKNSNNVNIDNECLELNTHTNSTSAITTTILVTIFTYLLLIRNMLRSWYYGLFRRFMFK